MTAYCVLVSIVALAVAPAFGGDLKQALAEPNLEKRSKLALENAKVAYQAARDAYGRGDMEQVKARAEEIEQSVDLAYQSLEETGKNPRNSPRYFKSAEQQTSELVRRLAGFQDDMSYDERPVLDKVKARVQKVHDALLLELIEGKKK